MEASEATHVLCPAINSSSLKAFSQRINRCRMSIVDNGDVAMEMMGKAPSGDEGEVTKELIYIASDGVKVQVYQNSEGVQCFGATPSSGTFKEYCYPHLPSRLWKKYLHAYKFVEVVKSKTPRIVLQTDKAKCKLMENGPTADFEVHFHDGVRILLSKGRIHISESNGGTMTLHAESLNHRVTERTMHLVDYAMQCQAECHRINESLMNIQARDNLINVFPVTIGTIHNPFLISQQTLCESNNQGQMTSQPSSDLNHISENPTEQTHAIPSSPSLGEDLQKSQIAHDITAKPVGAQHPTSDVPVYSFSDLNNSLALSHSQATQALYFNGSISCRQNTECQSGNNAGATQASAYSGMSCQQHCECNSIQSPPHAWAPPQVQHGQCQNVLLGSDSSCDIPGYNIGSRDLSNFIHSSDKISLEQFGASMTELDLPSQSSSSVPFSLSCQSENTTCQTCSLPGDNSQTPAKCQSTNVLALKQIPPNGCVGRACHSKDKSNDLDMKDALQTQRVKRNLFIENEMVDTSNARDPQQQLVGGVYPDLLDKCYTEKNQVARRLNAVDNPQINDYNSYQNQLPTQQPCDTLPVGNTIHKEMPNKQSFSDANSCSDKNEMEEIINKLEDTHMFSKKDNRIGASMNLSESTPHPKALSGDCHASGNPQLLVSPGDHLSQQLSSNPSRPDVPPLYISNLPHLQPAPSMSPKKLSRKVAMPSGSSSMSKSESFDLSPIDKHQQMSMKSDRSFPYSNDSARESLISGLSSGSDSGNSFNKLNTSLPNSLSLRKAMTSRHQQDKLFNSTFSHSASPSHSRLAPSFPMSPQKEFLQGGARDCQSSDAALPAQVRNSLDMSVSSYYSDSPSSSPSSSCDPIYQVFVPYTGWASYYAGGAIWLLYNDGTQLGVKATEAVMTFIDQDGTQKRYQNGDPVPEVVKMKLEKLPNVLKTVMKYKDGANTC